MREFRLLGPLEVLVDGQARSVRPGGERVLLTCLLLEAGRLVPADRLVDRLWGERLPANAANALQIRVSKLRQSLRAAGLDGDLLLTRPAGYQLAIEPDEVDVRRFERLVGEARRRSGGGEAVAARELYGAALALWRGPALIDAAGSDWADAERTRLDELRLTATEERLELDLQAGRHGQAAGELEALAADHPLRERLHGMLLLALYRVGRQADALLAYHALRKRLADELGIDPGPELQELAQSILRQDTDIAAPVPTRPTRTAALAAPAAVPAAPAVVAPPPRPPLPARLVSFLGRALELDRLAELLRSHRLVTLTGPGGVGKTALALEAARGAGGGYPAGTALVRLSGLSDRAQLADAVASRLDLLGTAPPSATPEDVLVRHFSGPPTLVVLDNCEHVIDACAVLVERLLADCPSLTVLATSREPLAVAGEVQLGIGPLAVPAVADEPEVVAQAPAARLFLDRVAAVTTPLTLDAATAVHVAQICRQLDGMPLALELAAARAKTLPVGQIAARLSDRFALLTTGSRTAEARQQTLRATVDWSHDLLGDLERVQFRRLAVFRGGWTLPAADAVCGFPPLGDDVLDLLGRLVDRSLVVAEPGRGRFRMLVTLREYARERLAAAGEHDLLADRHVTHFLRLAEAHGPAIRTADYAAASEPLRDDEDNLRAALDRCLDTVTTDPDQGLRLAANLNWYWLYGSREEGEAYLTALLEPATGSPLARAHALQTLALLRLYRPTAASRAAARESLSILDGLGERKSAAISRLLMGYDGIFGGGDTAACRRLALEARQVLTEDEEPWFHAMSHFLDLQLHLGLAEFAAAVPAGEQAVRVLRQSGDLGAISGVLCHLGIALRMSGQSDKATRVLQEAVAEAESLDLRHGRAFPLAQLGHCALDTGEDDRADTLFAQAVDAAREVDNPRQHSWVALGRARLAARRGDRRGAAHWCRTALGLFADSDYPWVRALTWSLLAECTDDGIERSAASDRASELSQGSADLRET